MMIILFLFAFFLFASSVWAGEAELLANLPPDPGPAGKATLAGIDSDNDGVRDDVQRWIVMTYPNSQKTKAALTQKAKTIQQFLLKAANATATYSNFLNVQKDNACLAYVQPSNYYQIIVEMKSIVLNTYLRSKVWIQASHSLSGKMFSSIPNRKQGCNFNPDAMPN